MCIGNDAGLFSTTELDRALVGCCELGEVAVGGTSAQRAIIEESAARGERIQVTNHLSGSQNSAKSRNLAIYENMYTRTDILQII